MRALLDRSIAVIARLVVRWLYRTVEQEGLDRLDDDRPTLLVANHFNGLVDPVLIVAGMGRLPRFMAKATLWKVVVARPFLRLAGIVPVYRARAVIVNLAGRAVATPVTKGTVRVLVAMVVFPLTWLALAVFDVGGGVLDAAVRVFTFPLSPVLDTVVDDRSGFWPSALVFVGCPLFGLATLWVIEHVGDLVRSWSDWRAVHNRRGQLRDVLELRTDLVETVHATSAVIG